MGGATFCFLSEYYRCAVESDFACTEQRSLISCRKYACIVPVRIVNTDLKNMHLQAPPHSRLAIWSYYVPYGPRGYKLS